VLYADNITGSIRAAVAETERRRAIQREYNTLHGIVPQTVQKPVPRKEVDIRDTRHVPRAEVPNVLVELEAKMYQAAEQLDFEEAIRIRDAMRELRAKVGD